jgi:hypothetical protein
MYNKTLGGLAVLVATLFFLGACSNTRVTSSWKASNATPLVRGNKILVLGIIQEKDIRLRMQMEGFLVDELKANGYNAVSAYTLYGPKMFSNKSEEAALAQLHNGNIDEVLTITLLDKARQRNWQPGPYYYPFWGYYSYMYGQVYNPGYISVDTRFLWESNLYDVNTRSLLSSIQSESFNPSSAGDMGRDYSRVVVKKMVKEGVLARN